MRDAITDRLRATAILRGEGERIEIRCESPDWGDVSVRYHSRRWLARGNVLTGQQPLIYRFDEQRPVRRLWHVHDRTASFDDRGRLVAFLRSLMGAAAPRHSRARHRESPVRQHLHDRRKRRRDHPAAANLRLPAAQSAHPPPALGCRRFDMSAREAE